MNLRSPLELTVAGLVVLVGLLIGGMFALYTRGANQQTSESVAVSSTTATARPVHRVSRSASPPRATTAPTAAPTTAPTAAPTTVPTVTPTVAPTRTAPPTTAPTALPSAAPTARPAVAPAAGVWRIEEANVQVGTIVWSGSGAAAGGRNAIALDVHKDSVAGHGISACERRTTLHTVVNSGAAPQTVPYREVNCSGVVSTGEMRVSTFSADGRTFSGSFWSDGSKLGDFSAART